MQSLVFSSSVFEDFCDLARNFVPCEFKVKWAHSTWEKTEALRLRRAIFCIEQGIFVGDDLDAVDTSAQMIVAIACVGGMADQVVGCVRIHQAEPGLWWGSRLAVHPSFRKHSHLATTLIRLAVSSAHARECRIFLAHVQSQNQPLFEKLGWQPLKAETLHGRSHQLMQADMAAYPPCYDPMTGFVTQPGAPRGRA